MAVTKKSTQTAGRLQARADTATPGLQAQAEAGHREATGVPAYEPTSYRYVGDRDAVIVVVASTAYEFRQGEPVHLAYPEAALDERDDFERVS